jgi:transketolase
LSLHFAFKHFTTTVLTLLERSLSVKKRFLAMYKSANAGHIGCALSCTEMLVLLKFHAMVDSDELVLSKGHAAASLYSVLAEAETLSESDIATFYKNDTLLAAHPPAKGIRGIPFATGSLGHGLSLASGIALGMRLGGESSKVFCVTSDGELNEGSTWEAALFAAHHRLTNLVWLIDRNGIQGIGRTEDVMMMEPLRPKLEAFGFDVREADGHDFASLQAALEGVSNTHTPFTQPRAVICNTVKGNSVSYMEDTVAWHYTPMNDEQYSIAQHDIEAFYHRQIVKEPTH